MIGDEDILNWPDSVILVLASEYHKALDRYQAQRRTIQKAVGTFCFGITYAIAVSYY